jgi:hypothetical protein
MSFASLFALRRSRALVKSVVAVTGDPPAVTFFVMTHAYVVLAWSTFPGTGMTESMFASEMSALALSLIGTSEPVAQVHQEDRVGGGGREVRRGRQRRDVDRSIEHDVATRAHTPTRHRVEAAVEHGVEVRVRRDRPEADVLAVVEQRAVAVAGLSLIEVEIARERNAAELRRHRVLGRQDEHHVRRVREGRGGDERGRGRQRQDLSR